MQSDQNIFLYSCDMSIFNNEGYINVGFPDQNIHLIKHLEIKVNIENGVETTSSINRCYNPILCQERLCFTGIQTVFERF